ncbi:MAG: hypothetical protein P1U56_00465 [Saprospiraceae bacterium]|nr:hypothetical protein [Saprospiraceae bacterium]
MKSIALILSLIIFSTSLKASAFFVGAVGAINGVTSSHSCCSPSLDEETKECESSNEEEQEEGCCKSGNCDCTCCLHIAYLQQFSTQKVSIGDFSDIKFDYSFFYRADYLASVFHPPAIFLYA